MGAANQEWDATDAAAACPIMGWRGPTWRFHRRIYAADDPAGSLLYPGRYHRGWPALYLSLRSHLAQGEVSRHLDQQTVPLLRDGYRLTEFWVELEAVLVCCRLPDCLEADVPGTTRDDLCRDTDFEVAQPTMSQQLGAAALARDVEGMLVPSCTGYSGGNLVLFPSQLRQSSVVRVVRSEDPTLYVDR